MIPIEDNLESTITNHALSANMGRVLKEHILKLRECVD